MFWFFFAIVVFVCYKLSKLVGRKFEHFLSGSRVRRVSWEWTKRSLFSVASFFLIIGTFQRWYYFHDEITYAKHPNLSYASQIETEVYLMSLQNVIDLFKGMPPNPDRQIIPVDSDSYPHPPSDPRFYLVIRIKNKGPEVAWGVLDYFVDGKKQRAIEIPPIAPQMDDFKNIVLQADFIWRHIPPTPGTFGPYPHLEVQWSRLHTSGEKK